MNPESTAIAKAKTIILKQGGVIRAQEAIKQGIHPRTLYQLRDSGKLEQLSRGLYQLREGKPLEYSDLITVAKRGGFSFGFFVDSCPHNSVCNHLFSLF